MLWSGAAVAVSEENNGKESAQDDRDNGSLGTECPASDDVGTVHDGSEHVFTSFAARDGKAEDVALGIVPCPMDADGNPQRA